jgi:hypothetical protein
MKVIKVSSRQAGPGTRLVLAVPPEPAGETSGEDALQPFDQTRRAAFEALLDREPYSNYRAVALLSRHLAVARLTLCPAAIRRLGRDDPLITGYSAAAREAERTLQVFERWLTGDAYAARLPAESMRALMDEHLGRYRAVERALLAGLGRVMPVPECEHLTGHYRALLATAPTRPHPRRARARRAGRLAFRIRGFWDRMRDTLDSRPGVSWRP